MSEPTLPEPPFATLDDLEDLGREVAGDEQRKVSTLLRKASRKLLDEMPAAVARAHEDTLRDIVCAMVLRVLDAAGPMPGLDTSQFGIGPFQESYRWANPTGDMYLTKGERRQLRGGQRAGSIDVIQPDAGDQGSPWPEA